MYIDNQKFYDEMCKSRENDQLTESGYEMLVQIVSLNIRKCYPPSLLSRCVTAYVLVEVEKQLHNFNPEHPAKPNSAFNYFGEISKNTIVKFKRKYKK